MDDMGGSVPPPPPPPGGGETAGSFGPRTIGDILSAGFELYKANAAKLIQVAAIVVIPLSLIQAVLLSGVLKEAKKIVTTNAVTGRVTINDSGGLGHVVLIGLVTILISVLVGQILTGALTRAAAGSLVGRIVDVNQIFRVAIARLGGLLALAILIAIVVGIGFVLLVIPGIIFGVMLSISVPVFMIEGKPATAAMGRSWELVRGHFWHVLGTTLVAAILVAIVNGILSRIGGSGFFGAWIFGAIGLIVTTPFAALVSVILYVDVRTRSERLDAAGLARELDQSAQA